MNLDDALEEAQERWSAAGASSDLGLWWVADDVRQLLPGVPEQEVRQRTLHALRPLLSDGTLKAVRLLPDGAYQPWEGSAEDHLARIESEWASLGHPPDIGDIVWFIGAR